MPKIRDLLEGTVFRYPELNKLAVLVRQGMSGARVRFLNEDRHVKISTELADAEFDAPGRPRLVSDASEVDIVSLPDQLPTGCDCDHGACEVPQVVPTE